MLTSTRCFLLFLIAFTLCLSSVIPSYVYAEMGEIKVQANILNVRSGPGLNDEIVGQVSKGTTYNVLKEEDNWYQIEYEANKKGWVASWLVEYTQNTGKIRQVESVVNPLNVRSGPGTSFQVITQIHPEQNFPLLKEEGEWVQIKLNDTENGWVANWLVEIKEGEAEEVSSIQRTASVQATILNVRSGPSTSQTIIDKLSEGQEIRVLAVQDGWYKIELSDGREGWVAGDYIAENGTSDTEKEEKKVRVDASMLNVRSNSSLDAKVIDKIPSGTVVQVIETSGEWLKVSYDNQKDGWIASWLTTEVNAQMSNQPKITILNQGTNIRNGPSTNHTVVQRADRGEQFAVVATEGEWFKIQLDDDETAYVAGWIVSAEGIDDIHRQGMQQYLKNKKVVIDAGHGGKDIGATGSHFNTLEKVVNLNVSNLLKEKFTAAGANVVMSRSSDRFITLQQRVDISIKETADVFLSIHHNTNTDSQINGTITYFYSNTDRTLANAVQKEIVKNNGLQDLKARKGNFFVLRENPRPSVLIEIGFLSNYSDELQIRQSRFQEHTATGIMHGVAKYFQGQDE